MMTRYDLAYTYGGQQVPATLISVNKRCTLHNFLILWTVDVGTLVLVPRGYARADLPRSPPPTAAREFYSPIYCFFDKITH